MRIIAILLGIFMLASPVYAKPIKKAEECVKIEKATTDLEKQGLKKEHYFTGDALDKVKNAASKLGNPAPDGVTDLLVMSHPKLPFLLGVVAIKNCVAQVMPINPEFMKKILSQDDGSI